MSVEERSKRTNRKLYLVELSLLKWLPYLIALVYFTNTLFSLFSIDLPILSYIAGMSLISIAFMYISSYVFQFCVYHRLPLHYVVVNIILCSIDYYIGIPIGLKEIIILHCCVFILFIFIATLLYLKSKYEKVN